ncbi:tRNA (Guanine37-N1) -methyltransferase [Clostridiaceae bacterium JG1575]|nr:tRNA (Guanine37-N1) -methyltransferase [Clostridiaceae bacterium JG1575]
MRIDVLTLFPEMFEALGYSILGRAQEKELLDLKVHNLRDFSLDKHRRVDEAPYGGGCGMVLTPQPVFHAVEAIRRENQGPLIFLGPRGKPFTQETARRLKELSAFTILCGHYEGIDERIYSLVDEEISLGDFVLTGGEVAALPIIDAVVRLLPGALGSDASSADESFEGGLLEYPQYTRPPEFQGMKVPAILQSGHHEYIAKWRRFMSLEITKRLRPDLYEAFQESKADHKIRLKIEKIAPWPEDRNVLPYGPSKKSSQSAPSKEAAPICSTILEE